ncbi:MAG: phage portal protein [Elusimicrobiaceae bacterium]|nr:phage portal protein [Elusimicrobiaceae bacterium]
MKWFQNLLDKQISKLGYAKNYLSPAGAWPLEAGINPPKLPDPSGHDFYPYMRAYADKAWVYACVSAVANAVAGSEFCLKNEKGRIVDDHPAMQLMYRPNSFMSGRELREWIIASLELTGNAYILKDARVNGRPGELFPLISHLVEVVPSKNPQKPIDGYRYRVSGKTACYKADDVIHFRYFNPFDFFYGLAPLAAARFAADTLCAAENYNRAFFENSATISGILSTDSKLDAATRERIMRAWNEKYRGPEKAHRVALLEGGLSWQSTGMSQKDMDFVAAMKLNRETVLAIFHVPPAMVGLFEYAPQYNTQEQQRIFWQNCVMPKTTRIMETLTEFLLPDFDPGGKLYFDPDFSGVSALRDDETARSQAAETYYRIGFSREEITEALGLPFPRKAKGLPKHCR